MVEISIICLVYKSKKLAKAVYDSLYKYTPKLRSGEAELIFVANDPTEELVHFLKTQKYPYIVNVNDRLSDEELFKLGFGKPEHMRRVYQGYNQGIIHAKGQKICLINSDNFFSQDWLENLLKYLDYKKVVCSMLVEPGHDKFGTFPFAISNNLGRTIETYRDEEFQEFAAKIGKTGYTTGGAYMPCLVYRDVAVMAGLYPEGNLAGKTPDDIKNYGDEAFYEQLKKFGVEHITAKDSIVYHLKEGEISEDTDDAKIVANAKYKHEGIGSRYKISPVSLISYVAPDSRHQEIISLLGKKITLLIAHFSTQEELRAQLKQVKPLASRAQIVVLYGKDNTDAIGRKQQGIEYIFANKQPKDAALYDLFHKMYGEHLLVIGRSERYSDDLLGRIDEKDKVYYLGDDDPQNGIISDSISKFIIPKRLILSNIGFFLGCCLSGISVEISQEKCIELNRSGMGLSTQGSQPPVSFIKSTLPYRIARKLYREGVRGVASAVASRLRKK